MAAKLNHEEFWDAIARRNGWTDETVVECKVRGIRKLCEQAFAMGKKSVEFDSAPRSDAVDDLLKRMGL